MRRGSHMSAPRNRTPPPPDISGTFLALCLITLLLLPGSLTHLRGHRVHILTL